MLLHRFLIYIYSMDYVLECRYGALCFTRIMHWFCRELMRFVTVATRCWEVGSCQ